MPLEIRKRSNGVYYCHGTIDGQRIRRSLGTRDQEHATRKKAEIEARLERSALYGPENEATFADACYLYLRDKVSDRDRRYIVPILKALGRTKLAKITPGMVATLARKLYPAKTHKAQSAKRMVIIPTRAIINYGHQHGLCHPIKIKFDADEDVHIRQAIDRQWIERFMDHAPPNLAAFALFCFSTGSRPSEALRLTPWHFDLDAGTGTSEKTKTGQKREFYLTAEMVSILRVLEPQQIQRGRDKGEWRVFGYARLDSFNLKRDWRAAIAKAGIKYVTISEAGRHSFATETVTRKKMDPVTAARIGNWANPAVMMKNYAHPDDLLRATETAFGARGVKRAAKVRAVK